MAGIELFLDDDYIVDLMQVSLLLFFQNNNTYRENIYIFNRILAKIHEVKLIKLMQIFLIF